MTHRGGVSVLEILIAVGILTVVLAVTTAGWLQMGHGSSRGQAAVAAMRDLELIFSQLRSDLRSVLIDRPITMGSRTIEVAFKRTTGADGGTLTFSFFKVYAQVPETMQLVAGQITYSLAGADPPFTLRRGIHEIDASGVAPAPRSYKDLTVRGVQSLQVRFCHRDAGTGALIEIPDNVLRHDSPILPDYLEVQVVHKDEARIKSYISIPSPYIRGRARFKELFYVDNWLVPEAGTTGASRVAPVSYQPGSSLNFGGTGVVLSTTNLR